MVRIKGGNLKNVREIIMGIERVEFKVVDIVFFLNLFYIVKWWKSKNKMYYFFIFIYIKYIYFENILILYFYLLN